MRRTALLALPLLALTVVPAGAAPAVGAERAVYAHFVVPSGSHSLDVTVVGTLPSATSTATEPRLRVLVRAADGAKSRYTAALQPGELQIADTSASLTTRLGALPVRIVWGATRSHGTVSVGSAADPVPGQGGSPFAGEGGDAIAYVKLGRATCRVTDALLGTNLRADADAASYGGPLAQAFPGLTPARAQCADAR